MGPSRKKNADQWQICSKMPLVLNERNPDLGPTWGGGGEPARLFLLFYKNEAEVFLGDPEAVLFAGIFLEVWTSNEKFGNCFHV